MQPKSRMTFRFEPPKPVRPQRDVEKPAVPAVPAGQDRPAEPGFEAEGPLQDDLYTLEDLIRRTGTVTLAPAHVAKPALPAGEKGPELVPAEAEPGWLPETAPPVIELLPPGPADWKDGPSWWRVFVSVAGAIATGALFGYLVLTLFTGDSPFPAGPAQGTEKPAQATAEPGGSPGPSLGEPGASPAGADSSIRTAQGEPIPEQTYYLLQYGVFRSEESLDAAIEQLKERRLPGTPDRLDGYRVYLGAAGTKEEAETLAGQLSGLEVFVKTVTLEPVSPGSIDPALSVFLTRSQELTGALTRLSVKALQDEKPQPLDPGDVEALKGMHRGLQPSADALAALPAGAKDAVGGMMRELNEAMASVEAYERGISRFHLWNIQSDVTEAILADRLLRTSLG